MSISGFTFVRNADKLDLPMEEAIGSVLPICEEFIVALGQSDDGDHTKERLLAMDNSKIRIIETEWEVDKFERNAIYAQQTDIAKKACSGDWLFYVQCDEVVHEKDLELIKNACDHYKEDTKTEGFLFSYLHFWGDFQHVQKAHGWYPFEIRIIRNREDIWSWRDAQSFRKYPNPPESSADYFNKEDTKKLNAVELPAKMYHYGYVRSPATMRMKTDRMAESYRGLERTEDGQYTVAFDYGPLNRCARFEDEHPKAMRKRIERLDWSDQLQFDGSVRKDRPAHKHEKWKNRVLSWIEQNVLGGRQFMTFKNYNRIGRYHGQ